MPFLEPLQWQSPHEAFAALKPLLDRSDGVVENVIVRLARERRYPLRGPRYRLARYKLIRDTGCWIDVATQCPLYDVIGFRLAE